MASHGRNWLSAAAVLGSALSGAMIAKELGHFDESGVPE